MVIHGRQFGSIQQYSVAAVGSNFVSLSPYLSTAQFGENFPGDNSVSLMYTKKPMQTIKKQTNKQTNINLVYKIHVTASVKMGSID